MTAYCTYVSCRVWYSHVELKSVCVDTLVEILLLCLLMGVGSSQGVQVMTSEESSEEWVKVVLFVVRLKAVIYKQIGQKNKYTLPLTCNKDRKNMSCYANNNTYKITTQCKVTC